jgi:hypothetical protein
MHYLITHKEKVECSYGWSFPRAGMNAGNLTMVPKFSVLDLQDVVRRIQIDAMKLLGIIPHSLEWEMPENSDIVAFKWMVDGDGPAIAFAMLVDGSVEELGEINTYGK